MTADELYKACGVGVVVSDADIAAAVAKAIDGDKAALVEDRYHYATGGVRARRVVAPPRLLR